MMGYFTSRVVVFAFAVRRDSARVDVKWLRTDMPDDNEKCHSNEQPRRQVRQPHRLDSL